MISLAMIGEQLSVEARSTIDICHEITESMNKLFVLGHDKDIGNQYLIIARQAHQRNTKLSAAGFSPVDHTMIVFIFTNVSTYFIVAYQLLSDSN